jgi:hypothetical protein
MIESGDWFDHRVAWRPAKEWFMRGFAVGRLVRARYALFALIALTLLLGPLTQDAAASKAWCRTDPIVVIDGHITDIFVAGPLEALLVATGPTEIVVTVPTGTDAWLLLADIGFGRGVKVSFAESDALSTTRKGVEVQVDVYVPASKSIPVRVDVSPRLLGILWPTSAEGVSNQWFSVRAVA